jgi:hypothetical protein
MAYTNATFFLDLEGGSDSARTALTSVTASNPSGTITRLSKTAHGLVTGAVVTTTAFTAWLNGAFKVTVVDANNVDLDDTVWQATADTSGTVTPRGGASKADAWKTITSGATSARVAAGDTVRLMASPDATSLGQSVSWTDNSASLTLTTAVTLTVDNCETAWTGATNVTSTAQATTYRQGTNALSLVIATAFTTGLIAYKALSNVDLSSYQQLSFWIRPGNAAAANTVSLKLCSDGLGVTALATLTIPYSMTANTWHPITIDTAGALPSGINSISLNTSADPGAVSYFLDHVIACQASSSADSLTLRSLIGKNDGSEIEWWPILSIDGTAIGLNGSYSAAAPTSQKYHGTTESVTTYKRESSNIAASGGQTFQQSGGAAGWLTYSGGWNRTDMSTQTGETWFSGKSGSLDSALAIGNRSNLKLSKLYPHLWNYGVDCSAGSSQSDIWLVDYAAAGVGFALSLATTKRLRCDDWLFSISSQMAVYTTTSYAGAAVALTGRRLVNSGLQPLISLLSPYPPLRLNFSDLIGGTYGLDVGQLCGGDVILRNARIRRSVTASVRTLGVLTCNNVKMEDATETVTGTVVSGKHDQTADNHQIFWLSGSGTIASAVDQRHTASGIAWKFSPLNAATVSEGFPLSLSVGKVACAASALVTVKLWMRRDHTGLSMRLKCPGGQLAGIASDVSASPVGSADAWEEVTMTFTPSEAGVVEVFAEAWGGTSYNGWVDDLSVTQA